MLDKTVYTYNQHMRWKRFDKAAQFVITALREKFTKTFEGSEDTLNIDDLEVKDIDFTDPNKVKVTVETRFYKLPSVTLEKKKWVQTWVRQGDEWWLEQNPLGPYFPDPASQPARDQAASQPK